MINISLPSSGCRTETGIDYYRNDVSKSQQPDVEACRRTCLAKKTAYFTFFEGNKVCYCKNSDAGKKQHGSAVSGTTSCSGQLSSQ